MRGAEAGANPKGKACAGPQRSHDEADLTFAFVTYFFRARVTCKAVRASDACDDSTFDKLDKFDGTLCEIEKSSRSL